MAAAYAVTVLRAQRPLPVRLSFTGGENPPTTLAFLNGRRLGVARRGGGSTSTTLAAGDNVFLFKVSTLAARQTWTLRLDVIPVATAAPGDLTVVPAEELAQVPALQHAAPEIASGASLPQSGGLPWRLVYADDFDRPRLGTDWDLLEGTWRLENGVMTAFEGWATMAYRGKLAAPVRVEYDLRPRQANDRRVMAVAFTPAGQATGRSLWGRTAGEGYFLAFGWHDARANQLWRGDKAVVVSDQPPFPVTGKWQHLVAQFIPPKAQLFVDGQLALEYTDPQWLPNLDTLSLFAWPGPADFDNLRLYTAP